MLKRSLYFRLKGHRAAEVAVFMVQPMNRPARELLYRVLVLFVFLSFNPFNSLGHNVRR